MNEPLLEVVNLCKSYGSGEQRIDVLDGISLELHKGESIALLGASGAGKSTLMHIMGALDKPTSGTVRFRGTDIFSQSERQISSFRNGSIGFVFQFHHLLPEFSALENVMMPALIGGVSRGEAEAQAVALLREVALGNRLSHKPGELSGGEQQRVAVARALVMAPELLLADEPTGNLDMKTSEGVHQLFTDLHESRGLTVMTVTHNEKLALLMSRQIRLLDGRLQC